MIFNILESQWVSGVKFVVSSSVVASGHCLGGDLYHLDRSLEVIYLRTNIFITKKKAFLNMKTDVQKHHLIFHI